MDIEKKMREEDFKIYLIAMVRDSSSMEYIRILILGVIGETDWRLHVPDQPSGQAQLQVRGRLLFQPQAAAGDSARALAPVGRGEPGSS